MKIALYRNLLTRRKNLPSNYSYIVYDALYDGFKTDSSVDVVMCDGDYGNAEYVKADIGVFNYTTNMYIPNPLGRWKTRNDYYNMMYDDGNRCMFVESSLISMIATIQNTYRRISMDHWQPDMGKFYNKNSPNDRWEKFKRKYNVDYSDYRITGDNIILCLSLPSDPTNTKY